MSGHERGIICMFCGEGFGYAGEKPDDETLKSAVDHEKNCQKNPYKNEIDELLRGNTALIIALMDMCQQHCSENNDLLCEDGLSSNEFAFSILQEAGFADEQAVGCYKLLWEKIRERDKLFNVTVPK